MKLESQKEEREKAGETLENEMAEDFLNSWRINESQNTSMI